MKNRILILLFLYIISLPLCSIAATKVGDIVKIQGKVNVISGGKFPAKKAFIGMTLYTGDILRTKSRSKAQVRLLDGTILKIGPRSRVDISEYSFDRNKFKASFNIKRGSIGAFVSDEVKKIIKADPHANKFEIKTPIAVAGVRGTNFIVTHFATISNIMVLTGKVYVYNPALPRQMVLLLPNQSTVVRERRPPAIPRPFSPKTKERILKNINIAPESPEKNPGKGKGGEENNRPENPAPGSINAPQPEDITKVVETGKDLSKTEGGLETATSFFENPKPTEEVIPITETSTFTGEYEEITSTEESGASNQTSTNTFSYSIGNSLPYQIVCDSSSNCKIQLTDNTHLLGEKYFEAPSFRYLKKGEFGTKTSGATVISHSDTGESVGIFDFGNIIADSNIVFLGPNWGGRLIKGELFGTPYTFCHVVGYNLLFNKSTGAAPKTSIVITHLGSTYTGDGIFIPEINFGITFGDYKEVEVLNGDSDTLINYDLQPTFNSIIATNLNRITNPHSYIHFKLESSPVDEHTAGIFQIILGANYLENTSDEADYVVVDFMDSSSGFYGGGIFLNSIIASDNEVFGDSVLYNSIKGNMYGSYMNLSAPYPETGILVGETIGTFDPNQYYFQAVTIGATLDTGYFLNLIDDPTGSGKDKLMTLGFPVVEIGSTSVSGSNGEIEVQINNMRFFATKSGTPPVIWVSNDVSGHYYSTVAPDTQIMLSGTKISNLTFKISQWDEIYQKWGAYLNSESPTFHGTIGSYKIEGMGGVAAGKIDPSTQSFQGTAAGALKAKMP